jgi:predicted ATP-grasp superfamily ATP-dependent carboligase
VPQLQLADWKVPALIVKIGHYPVHLGGLGAVRTLGRLGVPVYVVSEDAFTPAALSRYCADRFVWRTTSWDDPEVLAAGLQDIGRRIGRRSVAIPTDDEAATLIAEHAHELSQYFLIPNIRPDLPRQLASKHELYRLCCQHDVPAPASVLLSTVDEVTAFTEQATFPVVAKNAKPWVRRRAPVVEGTTVLHTPPELLALARAGDEEFSLLVQEYIPPAYAEDWIVDLYSDGNSDSLVFTGVKVRSWPPHVGTTSCAYAVANPMLANMARRFCEEIGFEGIANLDWRLDRRDGQYKLVDFNPRLGNQFRLFQTTAGIDVVRALHLGMTGRSVPVGEQVSGRKIVVEHFELPARLAYRKSTTYSAPSAPVRATSTELAWAARDDPVPFLAMWPRLAKPLASHLAHVLRAHGRRR